MAISYLARSWLLLIPLVPSMLVSIFTLYHLLGTRTLRSALNNHVIILLLVCGLIEQPTDIVWLIHVYRTGAVISPTPEFCRAWTFMSTVGVASIYFLMAWASIERHILIFHPHWLRTPRTRLLFHYAPLCVCVLWPMVFYGVVYLALPCDIPLDYSQAMCGLAWCMFTYPQVALFDSVVHVIVPSFVVIVFSAALLVRVVYYRYRSQQRVNWRNYKKITVQLLSLSTLYFFISFPPMILYAAYAAGLPSDVGAEYFADSFFFFYWIILFTPFASLMSLPDMRVKCSKFVLFWRHRNSVRPEIMMLTGIRAGHTVTALPQVVR